MTAGSLTISIDLELAWGVWDHLTADDLRLAEHDERPICAALLELFDRYEVPVTWAMVAGLLDPAASAGRPGPQSCWYAPDIIERIVAAHTPHEIGSHSGRHVYFDKLDAAQAREDLDYACSLHREHRLPFASFVYPRNAVGHPDEIARAGLRTYRGPDVSWVNAASALGDRARAAANLLDKALPVPPSSVQPRPNGTLTDIPGSMLLLGRNGLRRFVLPVVTRTKLARGLAGAARTGGAFHFWFHPSNFYYRRDEQLATLEWFLAHAAEAAGRGRIAIRTMGSYALH